MFNTRRVMKLVARWEGNLPLWGTGRRQLFMAGILG